MNVVYTTRSGLELLDEEDTPPGEIWFNVPKSGEIKMTYMISLNDWRVTLKDGEESFLDTLDRWMGELRSTVEVGPMGIALSRIDLIRQAMKDWRHGKS